MAEDEPKEEDKRLKNNFWEQRSTHGRAKIFTTPEILWDAASQYFQWALDNPLMETIIQGGKEFTLPKMRAMTLDGLCIYLDVGTSTFNDYSNPDKEEYKGFSDVTTRIRGVIRTQKFEGASAGFLNANIIARDIGLVEKQEVTGKDGKDLIPSALSDAELLTRMDKISQSRKEG